MDGEVDFFFWYSDDSLHVAIPIERTVLFKLDVRSPKFNRARQLFEGGHGCWIRLKMSRYDSGKLVPFRTHKRKCTISVLRNALPVLLFVEEGVKHLFRSSR